MNALVVKSVDTKDLKSLPIRECQFESGRGHQKGINYENSNLFINIFIIFFSNYS